MLLPLLTLLAECKQCVLLLLPGEDFISKATEQAHVYTKRASLDTEICYKSTASEVQEVGCELHGLNWTRYETLSVLILQFVELPVHEKLTRH